ncbi:hypothetical protein Tco_0137052 [Tanacetum coccineum]
MRHFAREYRGSRNQESWARNQESSRRNVNVEETDSKAMVAIDGAGFDWSYDKCTDKSKITRKQSKMGKLGHENQKSTKRSQRIKAEARKAKPQSKSAKISKRWSTKVNKAHFPFITNHKG